MRTGPSSSPRCRTRSSPGSSSTPTTETDYRRVSASPSAVADTIMCSSGTPRPNRSSMLRTQGKEVAMYDVEDPRREGYTSPWGGAPETPAQPAPPPAPSAEPPPERTWEPVDRVAEPAGEMVGTAPADQEGREAGSHHGEEGHDPGQGQAQEGHHPGQGHAQEGHHPGQGHAQEGHHPGQGHA